MISSSRSFGKGSLGEQAEGVDAPEWFVAASGSRQEVGEVGDAVRAGADFSRSRYPSLIGRFRPSPGSALRRPGSCRPLDTTGVDKSPGIRRTGTDYGEQVLPII